MELEGKTIVTNPETNEHYIGDAAKIREAEVKGRAAFQAAFLEHMQFTDEDRITQEQLDALLAQMNQALQSQT